MNAVARALNAATTLAEAAPRVLEALAPGLGFTGGAWWRVDASMQLQRLDGWGVPGAPTGVSRGEAWRTRQPVWAGDGTLSIPLICGGEAHGVIELTGRAPGEPGEDERLTAATIGLQVGQFVERIGARSIYELFHHVPVPISVLRGPELIYDLVNAAQAALMGNRPALGRSMFEVFPELRAQRGMWEPVLEVLRTGESRVNREHPVYLKNREGGLSERFFSTTLHPLRDASGVVTSVVSVSVEVTDQVLARQRVEQIANAVPELVWTNTPEGKNDFYNQRWAEYAGLAADGAEQDAFMRTVHPDDRERVSAAWSRSMASGEQYEAEVRLRRADGAWRWHLARGVPVKNAAGKIVKWVGSATDIDDHKRSEETSRLLAQSSALLNSSLDYEATLQTIARLAVPKVADWCSVHLQNEGEPLPRQIVVAHENPEKVKWAQELQKVFPQDPDATSGAIAVIRTGKAEFYPDIPDAMLVAVAKSEEQLRILREIGFRSAITVPLTAHGKTFGCIGLVRAESRTRYTQRDLAAAHELAGLAAAAIVNSRLYRDAQRAIRVRDDFLSVASHELKTPLTPLQLQLQSLQRLGRRDSEELSPRVASKLDVIGRQVSRMERLINRILDVARVSGDVLDLEYQVMDLSAMAREVGERFRVEQGTGVGIVIEAPSAVEGSWDPLRVDQIVSNLVSNAMKFGDGKPIEISVRKVGAMAELVVRDDGIGISAEDQARIFERFERAAETVNYGGLGLGLWISRELVERLGGTIKCASSPGAGSTFTVLLPLERPITRPRPSVAAGELSH